MSLLLYTYLFFWTLPVDLHDFHLSKCTVDFTHQEVQVSMHIFLDDLEAAIGVDDIKLFSDKEHPLADSLVYAYLADKLQVFKGDSPMPLTYLGKEISEDLQAGYFYLYASIDQPIHNVKITNRILLESFDDQRNMLLVNNLGNKVFHKILDQNLYTADLSEAK